MLIPTVTVTGRKTYEKKEGLAADFCPICRRAVGVQVGQIRSQAHVNYVGFGEGDLVGRNCTCLDCGSFWALRPGTIQAILNPTESVSLETLLADYNYLATK